MPLQPKNTPPYYEGQNPIKKYVALLTQSGTDAPVATILINTLGGIPVWSRINAGSYKATLNGAFIENRTTVINTPGQTFISSERNSNDEIRVYSLDVTGSSGEDNWIINMTIEITIY